jgi:hypothetical protein
MPLRLQRDTRFEYILIDADRVLDQRMFVRAIFWHSVKKIKSKNVKVLCKGSHDKRMQKALSSGGVMIKKLEL